MRADGLVRSIDLHVSDDESCSRYGAMKAALEGLADDMTARPSHEFEPEFSRAVSGRS